MLLHRVLPDGAELNPEDLVAALRPAERAPAERPFVFTNMVSTLDGRATVDGTTRGLGGEADLAMLLELRTVADAVLIGPGTVRAEGYGRLVRAHERRARRRAAGLSEDPTAVIVSRGLDAPWDAGLFQTLEQPVLVYTGSRDAAPAVPASVEIVRLQDLRLAGVLSDLRRRGIRALLCEGGPTINRALLEAGAVDELFLTLVSLLTGDGEAPAIVAGGAPLTPLHRARMRWLCTHGDELLLRYEFGI